MSFVSHTHSSEWEANSDRIRDKIQTICNDYCSMFYDISNKELEKIKNIYSDEAVCRAVKCSDLSE